MLHRILRTVTVALLSAVVVSLPASKVGAQGTAEESLPETFSAFAVVMGNIGTGHTESLTIRITRWSTPEERQRLLDIIIEAGEESTTSTQALREALQKEEETGFVRSNRVGGGGFPSERLRYAWQYRDEETGNRRIILALDRPIGLAELWASPRTLQYTVSIIVLDVDAKGQGSGILSIGSKVHYDRDLQRFVMEYYSTEPVRLTNVRQTSS